MHIQNCLHPQVFINKYTGLETVVSCGKCAACQLKRVNHWVTRLDLESDCHKYKWFVTTTYDEQHIDQLVRLRYDDYPDGVAYINSATGEIYEFSDPSITRRNKKDYEFVKNTKVLPVLNKADVQKFIKLVRYYAKKLDKNAQIRYYYTGEIGPTTYRPHGHVIFWFDSDIVNAHFAEILHKAWKHGNIYDPHPLTGSASAYVASYINSLANLPSIYQHKSLRPFSLFSKCPPIGSLVKSLSEVPTILDRQDTTFRVLSKSSGSFVDVPLWRSLLDRYYPRVQRFSVLSVSDRIALYGLSEKHYFEDPYKFADFLYFRYVRSRRIDFVSKYLYDICHVPCVRRVFSYDGRLAPALISDTETNINSLVRFCRILLRVRAQSSVFGLSIAEYVTKISDYYDKIDKQKLKQFYVYQDSYFKSHDVKEFLLMDAAFVKRVNGKMYDCLSAADKFYLDLYAVQPDSDGVVHLDFFDSMDYRNFKYISAVRAAKLTKSKQVNDEVYSLRDDYQELLNQYLIYG